VLRSVNEVSILKVSKVPARVVKRSCPTTFEFPVRLKLKPQVELTSLRKRGLGKHHRATNDRPDRDDRGGKQTKSSNYKVFVP